GHLRLYGLLDGRYGNKLFNSTEQFRCGLNNCQGRNDPKASLPDQAAAVANILGRHAGYIQDANCVKLREVSLTYDAPASLAKKINASSVSFTISGHNLHTWTSDRGLDPELNEAGQNNNFTTADFLTQPPVRQWIGRAHITFLAGGRSHDDAQATTGAARPAGTGCDGAGVGRMPSAGHCQSRRRPVSPARRSTR